MKFLCDQCKAKYQIADEKVQGKTLRMKCRKCGHVIEIKAEEGAAASGATVQLSALSDEAAASALASTAPARPAAGVTAPGKIAPRPAAAPRPQSVAPGKLPTGEPARPSDARAAPRPSGGTNPRAAQGALASAFTKQVGSSVAGKSETPSSPAQDPPAEEWYAAIGDVPVGPIRLTELRAKYAEGSLTDDSLVWREGFEEWRPLRSLPELHHLVREEVSGAVGHARGSLLPPTGGTVKTGTRPATASTPAAKQPAGRGQSSAPTSPAAARGNVIPFSPSRGAGAAAARKIEEEDEEDDKTRIGPPMPLASAPAASAAATPRHVADPFAPAAPAAFGFGAPIPAATAPAVMAPAAVAVSPSPASSGVEEVARSSMFDAIGVRTRGISKGIVALIAAACLLFGVLLAVFLVKPRIVERVVEKRVEVPGSAQAPIATTVTGTATAGPEASASAAKVAVVAKPTGGGAAPAATTAAPASSAPMSKKLGGLDMGPEGPSVGPNPGGAGGGGGGSAPLDGKIVEGVVNSKRVSVRKVCYEPWADKGQATVKINLKVSPSGSVSSSDIVSSSGEQAVAQCVQRLSKGWTFPSSEAGGTFGVPFFFGT